MSNEQDLGLRSELVVVGFRDMHVRLYLEVCM